jgi:hypothetical protein
MKQKGHSSLLNIYIHYDYKNYSLFSYDTILFFTFPEKIIKHLSIICRITIANTPVFEEPGNR